MAVRKGTLSIALDFSSIVFTQLFEVLSRARRIQINQALGNVRNIRLPRFNKKNLFRILLPAVLILVVVLGLKYAFTPGTQIQGVNTSISVADTKPLATTNVNRSFAFPLRDQKGKEVGSLTYNIENAELRKQIIVKGKRATAVDGRIFLIINLKLVNELNQGLDVNSRDYIRVTVNGNTKELFAPDIHNDPVEVQAISTKNTRVGIAINETDSNIELQVGEINGTKERIKLSFNK